MKKWMIIYSLLLVFIGFYLSGHSGIVTNYESAGTNLPVVIKKKIPLQNTSGSGSQGDYKRIHASPRSTAPSISFFFLAERSFQVPANMYRQQQQAAPVKKEIIRDRLQHLFPSHYFW